MLKQFGPVGKALLQPEQQIDPVGVIVAGDELRIQAPLGMLPGGIEQQVHGPPGGGMLGIVGPVAVAPPGIIQMREIEFVDLFRFDQVQHFRQFVGIVQGHGEAQTDLDPGLQTQAHAGQRGLVSAFVTAKGIVCGADAVQGNANVVIAGRLDGLDIVAIDQRAVGGQADIEAHFLGLGGDLEDVRAQQRLAAREDQHGHAKFAQVRHHREDFVRAQFAGEIRIGGDRIAVFAIQVATPDQVPDHHRSRRSAFWRIRGRQRRRRNNLAHVLANTKHNLSPIFGGRFQPAKRKPVFFRMR